MPSSIFSFDGLAKLPVGQLGHAERRKEFPVSIRLRSFTSFTMTERLLLQESLFPKL
jgi:hypothetical protein